MERFYGGSLEPLGDREVGVIAATSDLARDGHVLEVGGLDLTNYRKNPVALWQHQADCPVGVATAVGVRDGALCARIAFAPPGISALVDQICSLVKAGVVKGVSIGFDPKDGTPLDPNRPRGGQRITRSELLEISFVSIPADTGAAVIERAAKFSRGETLAIFRTLSPVPRAAIERAAARVPRFRAGPILSHAAHVWLLQEQRRREEEAKYSREARQRELDRLRVYREF